MMRVETFRREEREMRLRTLTMFGVVRVRASGPLYDGDLMTWTLRERRSWAINAYNDGVPNGYMRDQRAGKVKVMKFTLLPAGAQDE